MLQIPVSIRKFGTNFWDAHVASLYSKITNWKIMKYGTFNSVLDSVDVVRMGQCKH